MVPMEMFSRHAIGVRAHADGVRVKLANLTFVPMPGTTHTRFIRTSDRHSSPRPISLVIIRCPHVPGPELLSKGNELSGRGYDAN